ncbi:MAG: alpha/beta hydrolase [Bacteroidales bacterium]|nr:alpha/beta hydrolase [Bacteroidales bacterium]
MKQRLTVIALLLFVSLNAFGWEREYIWPKGKMPDAQPAQVATMTDELFKPVFDPDTHREPYLEWFDAPAPEVRNGGCMILTSGGGYETCCDIHHIKRWREAYTALGFQCVNFVYRTPRPEGLPVYQSAWEDGQRAVRVVRSEAAKRGYDPEKIGAIGMSAGSHMILLLATSSQTPAYKPIDKIDRISCHLNWAVVNSPAYVTSDGENGTEAQFQGFGPEVTLSKVFKFDEKTCPMTLHHGGADPYSPNGSTMIYRKLHEMGIPAELHLYPNKPHMELGAERAHEFLRQLGLLEPLQPEVLLSERYNSDEARSRYIKEPVWPEGKIPDLQEHQWEPYIEWHFPKKLKTKAIQIVYSGGSYINNDPDSYEAAPARRYLNEMGMTVVTLKYRCPRPNGMDKYITAWQDLQRTVRLVRSKAADYGLDPNQIGIMGCSAGGHLTMMGVASSQHQSYLPIDEIDTLPCNVQWAVGIYVAYTLSDDDGEGYNLTRGCGQGVTLNPELIFDKGTCPMFLIHGDADEVSSMASVYIWERLRAMGLQSELHTLALRDHGFQKTASPGTGSYNFLDRIGEWLRTMVSFEQ